MLSRLKETHPTTLKIRKLESLADNLQLSISRYGSNGLIILDKEFDLEIRYLDNEEGYTGCNVSEFPHQLETKLIIGET